MNLRRFQLIEFHSISASQGRNLNERRRPLSAPAHPLDAARRSAAASRSQSRAVLQEIGAIPTQSPEATST
jgi:hypothetical protein